MGQWGAGCGAPGWGETWGWCCSWLQWVRYLSQGSLEEQVTRSAEVMAMLVGRGATEGCSRARCSVPPDCSEGGPGELAQRAEEIFCTDQNHPMLSTELAGCLIPLLAGDLGNAGGHCVAVRAMASSSSNHCAIHHAQFHLWEGIGGLLWGEHHLGS